MKPSKKVLATSVAAGSFAALVVSTVLPFTKGWEGADLVARRDAIGTGHPLTYCFGQTSEFGKVRVGTRFTPAQCDALLAKSLPAYLHPLQACIKRPIPVKSMAALLDAAYNAGPTAVCKSPMAAHANQGELVAACGAFQGWYIHASGRVVQGLINRRLAEKRLCLEGITERPVKPWWQRWAQRLVFWVA